jgi:MFS family permease
MERLWTRSFISMTVGMFFLFTAFYMLYPTLPLFIKQMGGNESFVGLAMGAFMLSAVAFRPLIGGFLDRFGRRPFILWGLSFFAVIMYLYNLVDGLIALMILRVLHGMSWGVTTTAIMTAVTDLIPANRRGEGMGWSGLAMTLAMAIGPLFGIWISEHLSFQSLFIVAVVLSIAALFLIMSSKMNFTPQKGTKKIDLFEKSVLPVTAVVFFLFIAYGGLTTFVPLFANSISVNSGTFFLVYAATLVLVRPLGGRLSDRYSEKYVIVPTLIITILSLCVLSFSTSLLGVLVSAVLYGIGFGSAQPVLQAAIIRMVKPERSGVANASFSTATDLGIGLGAILLGWVSEHTSYRIVFFASALSVVFSLLVFTIFIIRRLKKNRKTIIKTESLSTKTS